jgi:hypothetical protein
LSSSTLVDGSSVPTRKPTAIAAIPSPSGFFFEIPTLRAPLFSCWPSGIASVTRETTASFFSVTLSLTRDLTSVL